MNRLACGEHALDTRGDGVGAANDVEPREPQHRPSELDQGVLPIEVGLEGTGRRVGTEAVDLQGEAEVWVREVHPCHETTVPAYDVLEGR